MLTSNEPEKLYEDLEDDEYDGSDIPSGSYCTADGCWLPSQDGVFDFESEF